MEWPSQENLAPFDIPQDKRVKRAKGGPILAQRDVAVETATHKDALE